DALRADAGEEVRTDHPLVVLGDELSRFGEALPRGNRGQCVDHSIVESDEGRMGLGHRQVLVVPWIRDDGPPLGRGRRPGAAGEIEAVLGRDSLGGDRLPNLEVEVVVLVEYCQRWFNRCVVVQGLISRTSETY